MPVAIRQFLEYIYICKYIQNQTRMPWESRNQKMETIHRSKMPGKGLPVTDMTVRSCVGTCWLLYKMKHQMQYIWIPSTKSPNHTQQLEMGGYLHQATRLIQTSSEQNVQTTTQRYAITICLQLGSFDSVSVSRTRGRRGCRWKTIRSSSSSMVWARASISILSRVTVTPTVAAAKPARIGWSIGGCIKCWPPVLTGWWPTGSWAVFCGICLHHCD